MTVVDYFPVTACPEVFYFWTATCLYDNSSNIVSSQEKISFQKLFFSNFYWLLLHAVLIRLHLVVCNVLSYCTYTCIPLKVL